MKFYSHDNGLLFALAGALILGSFTLGMAGMEFLQKHDSQITDKVVKNYIESVENQAKQRAELKEKANGAAREEGRKASEKASIPKSGEELIPLDQLDLPLPVKDDNLTSEINLIKMVSAPKSKKKK